MKFKLLKIGLMMERRITSIFLLLICLHTSAQQYVGTNGKISFFSEAPMEDIKAINSKVSSVYDSNTNEIVFQLRIQDFIFPKKLMQEHFNENYLESDIYPSAIFIGRLVNISNSKATVQGDLTIHGKTNKIKVDGVIKQDEQRVNIEAEFMVKLEDYDIKIPRIVMYKIAERIDIKVNIELEVIK